MPPKKGTGKRGRPPMKRSEEKIGLSVEDTKIMIQVPASFHTTKPQTRAMPKLVDSDNEIDEEEFMEAEQEFYSDGEEGSGGEEAGQSLDSNGNEFDFVGLYYYYRTPRSLESIRARSLMRG